MNRQPGVSVRLKLTLSYAGFLMVAGFLMLAAAWFAGQPGQSFDFLGYVPDGVISTLGGLVPGNDSFLLRAFAPAAAVVLEAASPVSSAWTESSVVTAQSLG